MREISCDSIKNHSNQESEKIGLHESDFASSVCEHVKHRVWRQTAGPHIWFLLTSVHAITRETSANAIVLYKSNKRYVNWPKKRLKMEPLCTAIRTVDIELAMSMIWATFSALYFQESMFSARRKLASSVVGMTNNLNTPTERKAENECRIV